MSLTDFKKYTEQDFTTAFQKEVKNGDFRELLTWHTEEGFDVSPFYFKNSTKEIQILSAGNDWEINQEVKIDDVQSANKKALIWLERGATSISFIGKIDSYNELEKLLDGIGIQFIEINFKKSGTEVISFLQRYCNEKQINTSEIRGCFYQEIEDVSNFFSLVAGFQNMRFVSVNAARLHNAGGTISQELGFVIANANEILFRLIEAGVKKEDAIRTIQFRTSTGPNFFFEIAKLRTLRILWKNITEQYLTGNNIPVFIHAETSKIWLAKDGVNNNLIRSSFQSMSAILGGCNALTVQSFKGDEEENNLRLSMNVQLVCKEEGFLDKVGDVSSGANYIEEISHQLVSKSWKIFQETERKGGFGSCMKSGYISKEINLSALKLKQDIASGKIKVIGVNKHREDKSEILFKSELPENPDLKAIDLFA